MTPASLDVATLIDALERHAVAYVVVGSVAAAAHAVPDIEPGDLDIVPATDPPNLRRLAAALADLGAEPQVETGAWKADGLGEWAWVDDGVERPPRPLDPHDPETFDHSFVTRAGRLDVVPRIAGAHDDLRARATRLEIGGRGVLVASPADVLARMTSPKRAKDVARVAHLRELAARPSGSGVGFVGFRTDRFDEMVALFRDGIGLEIVQTAPGATWFRLGTDAQLHVYADTDPDHAFFTTGPVVGIRVDDVDATRLLLGTSGIEMLSEVECTESSAWCHVRAPDGTVFEIIGPGSPESA